MWEYTGGNVLPTKLDCFESSLSLGVTYPTLAAGLELVYCNRVHRKVHKSQQTYSNTLSMSHAGKKYEGRILGFAFVVYSCPGGNCVTVL